jgi:hypothetical protein
MSEPGGQTHQRVQGVRPEEESWWRKLKDDDGDGDEVAVCSYSVSTPLLKVLGSS